MPIGNEEEIRFRLVVSDDGTRTLEAFDKKGAKLGTTLNKTTKSTGAWRQEVNRTTTSLRSMMTVVGGLIGAGGITALGKATVQLGMNFERTMKVVQAWSGASQEEYKKMSSEARKWASVSEHTASQAASALKFYASAGLSVREQIEALPRGLELATATQADLGAATDITTDTMTAFMLEVEELNRVNDAFVATTSSSNTNIYLMGESMKYAAPVAAQLGKSVEYTSGMIGMLANAGIKGSMAGTNLVRVFMNGIDVLQDMGIEQGNYIEMLRRMKEEQWDMQRIEENFGLIAAKSAAVLMNNVEALEKFIVKIEESGGITQKQAEVMRDSTDFAFREMRSTIEEQMLSVWDMYDEKLRDVFENTSTWLKDHKGDIESLVTTTVSAGAEISNVVLPALSGLVELLGKLSRAYNEFPEEVTGAAGVGIIGAIIGRSATVGAAAAYLYTLVDSFNEMTRALEKMKAEYNESNTELAQIAENLKVIEDLQEKGMDRHPIRGGMTRRYIEKLKAENEMLRAVWVEKQGKKPIISGDATRDPFSYASDMELEGESYPMVLTDAESREKKLTDAQKKSIEEMAEWKRERWNKHEEILLNDKARQLVVAETYEREALAQWGEHNVDAHERVRAEQMGLWEKMKAQQEEAEEKADKKREKQWESHNQRMMRTSEDLFFRAFTGRLNDMGDVSRMIFDQVARQASKALSQALFGGGDGGGFWSTIVGGGFGGFLQGGGHAQVGKAYVVGESGPEVFVPEASGHVYPNAFSNPTAMPMSGRPMNIRIHLENKSSEELETSQPNVTFNAEEMILAVVIDGMDRNKHGMKDFFKKKMLQ